MSEFGASIAEARVKAGMSQRALSAELLGHGITLDSAALSRLENGQRAPKLREWVAIADILGMTLPNAPVTNVDLGEAGRSVARNVRLLRTHRGLTLRDLANVLGAGGHPISHSGLSKVENGLRRVDVDDLVALALALGVAPSGLLTPIRLVIEEADS